MANQAHSGSAGASGSPGSAKAGSGGSPNGAAGSSFPGRVGTAGAAGTGIGGGLDLVIGGTAVIDNATIFGNIASTTDNDVHGKFTT